MKASKGSTGNGIGILLIVFGCVIIGQPPVWLTIPIGTLLIVIGIWKVVE